MHIKKNDNIIVLTGKDKGKSGTVIKSMPSINKVIVSGINIAKRHTKARRGGEKGQIVEKPMPIHVSNIRLADKAKTKRVSAKK